MGDWFREAKLGVFLHWGVYAVHEVTESWAFYTGDMDYDRYMEQCRGFAAERFDPREWAALFRAAGARYAVLTAKHHDGIALWDTRVSDLNVVRRTPAGRDLIAPYCEAMREAELKVGLYFSHLDWSHPDYASLNPASVEWWATNRFTSPAGEDEPHRWERFLAFHRAQLHELMTGYGPIDLLWFDGEWERTSEQWRFADTNRLLRAWQPDIVMNGRIGSHGDYKTPEQGLPTVAPQGNWELCMTLGDSWGYKSGGVPAKPLRRIVRLFAECLAMGGNLLLGIGPRPDGTIDERQADVLRRLGDWIRPHAEAIYGTGRGLPPGLYAGPSTLSPDCRTLFLFHLDIPADELCVRGIRNAILSARTLGSETALDWEQEEGFQHTPGLLWIALPQEASNPVCTVVQLELDGPLDLYLGEGSAIQAH